MATKKGSKWACSFCGEVFSTAANADMHSIDKHEPIYIPILPEELNRLLLFIYGGKVDLLSPELINRLKQYQKEAAIAK